MEGGFLDRRTSALEKTSDVRLLESGRKQLLEYEVEHKNQGARHFDMHLEE